MVPKRIKLAGFLCYRDEQEVAFDGSALWMLSGLNGSGKSSIFDAVTYALFGYHRGGSQGAAELINKGENGFAVEFDFQLEGALHRIKRTLKRRAGGTAATQQVLKWQPGAAPDDGEWEAIADTQRKVEFDNWVRDHIGLNYETFTSSVLLLQGRSEKLLDSTAKGRAEVLASIVDLERYQQLHERADGQRKTLRGQVETLQNQLNAIPEVTEIELLAALNRIEDAKEAVKLADAEVEQLQVLEYQSKQWAEVQRKLSAALTRRAQAGKLIQDADKIEKELTRLRELRDVLPHVDVIFQRRNDLSGSEERTKVHAQELRDLEGKLGDLEHNLEQTRRRRAAGQKRIAADEARLQELSKSLPSLAAVLERVKLVEQRRADLRQLEEDLAKFPADLTVKVGDIQKKIDELTGLERAVSPLARLAEARRELKEARERAGDSERTEAQIKARGEEIRSRHDALKPSLETARVALRQVEEKLASERALLKQAAEQRDEFDHLDGAKLCRTCGQNLTPAHYREEKARRDKARAEAEDRVRQALLDLKEAQAAEKAITDQFRDADQQIQTARDEYRDARNHLQQAQKDVARLAQDCQRAYTELAEPFRRRVWADLPADWTATTFPTAAELDEARRSAMALPALRRELEHNRDALSRCNSLTTQIAAARVALADLSATVTGDPGEIRREFARLDAEGKALAEQLKASRSEERSAQSEIDSFAEESARLREAISDRTGKLRTEEATRKMCQQAIAAARKALPADWQSQADRVALAEMNRLRGEKEELERKDIEARAEQLRGARIEAESLRQTLDDLERDRDQFPAEARRDLAEVQTQLAAARAAYSAKADALNAARNERANLDARAQQRQSLRTQLTGAERELKHCKTLAELLGRDRLQRHLVRQAERQIVDYANSVLDRLSGGTLMLRLVGGEDGTPTDQALELEAYNRATGQAPINVAFLSGSQRFRVAVSLALGIGQYASRLHRPIESVIIDEGFGCLDRQGRQVMIQELHNLRGHLHCILLVSHQEEFAEAFADGYRFELADGSTKISRFQR